MTTKTYAELLDEVSIKITPNDAAILSQIFNAYVVENKLETNKIAIDLLAKLNPTLGDC